VVLQREELLQQVGRSLVVVNDQHVQSGYPKCLDVARKTAFEYRSEAKTRT